MNGHERVTKVAADVPEGYEVTHHESRGYDSPDRWFVAKGYEWFKECGTQREAERACHEHAEKMRMHGKLVAAAKMRYEPGTGPWSKRADLDQVDLAYLEDMVKLYQIDSGPKGLLGGCIVRLTQEVRRARGWPEPG